MKIVSKFIFFSLSLLLASTTAHAETRYISDHLIVTVRSGKGNEFKILETLPTATQVQIVEEDKSYVKVITPKGTEGYIRRHYVSKALPKQIQIEQLDKKIVGLQQQLQSQKQETKSNQGELLTHQKASSELSTQLNQTQQQLDEVNVKYQTLLGKSENVLNLSTENDQLAEENNLLNSELLVLREENQNFHRSNMIQWFLAGGGVFLGGWLIGKVSRKKQRRF